MQTASQICSASRIYNEKPSGQTPFLLISFYSINISLLIENWLTKLSTLSKYAEFDTQLEQQHLGYLDIYATQSLLKGNGSQHRIYEGHNLKRSLSSFQSDSCKHAPKNPTTSAVVITRRDRETADSCDRVREQLSNPVRQDLTPGVFSVLPGRKLLSPRKLGSPARMIDQSWLDKNP